jgi:hypothetical protein
VQEMVDDLLWQARMASSYEGRWGHRRHGRGHQCTVADWGRHPLFLQQISAAVRAERASDGQHGSRADMSFGGGSSAGGGGGGW